MLRIPKQYKSTEGAALIAAILTVAVLASVSAGVLFTVGARHQDNYQAAGWREALVAAEAGVERAMADLRTTIDDPAKAWAGWVVVDSAGNPASSQTIDRDGRWATGYTLRLSETLAPQAGETRETRYAVLVDVPSTLAPTARRWNQSYRIRSTGISVLPGAGRAVADKRDTQLRRLSLLMDRTVGLPGSGSQLARPEATRTIEVVAKPESVYEYALAAEINFKLNKKTFTDGFNSNYPESSIDGKYDPTKRTPKGGTILANRWKKKPKPDQAVEKFDLGKATIYGDLAVRGSLKNVKNHENVQGAKLTNTSVDMPTNLPPVWPSVTANIKDLNGKIPDALKATYKIAEKNAKAGGPAAQFAAASATAAAEKAAKGMELLGGSDPSNPTRYKVEKIEVNKKDESIVLSNPPGVTESWIEIWVTEEMKIEKGGTIFVSNGVHAKLYLEGKKVEIKETRADKGGLILESGFAGDFQLIGIEAKEETNKETDDEFSPKKRSGSIKISDADFTGVINAPDWDVDFKPKDWDKEDTIYGGQFYGSVLGRKVKIGNGADVHFDEALTEIGSVARYSIAGWNELER
jgi:hypothetical protein